MVKWTFKDGTVMDVKQEEHSVCLDFSYSYMLRRKGSYFEFVFYSFGVFEENQASLSDGDLGREGVTSIFLKYFTCV